MDMQGSRALAVTQEQAWEALNDPDILKACIAGCDKLERTAENQYTVGVAVKIGPVAAKFTGRITLADVKPPESYTLGFDGQGGAAGFGKGEARVKLQPQGTGCELSYSVRAQVGGKIAQLGQRLIDGVARGMAEDFFKRFDQEMRRRHPQAYAAAAAEAPQPAAQEVVGRARTAAALWMWVGAAAVVLAGLVWWMR
jgi:carbon monoxide dehydrogenase subunit G